MLNEEEDGIECSQKKKLKKWKFNPSIAYLCMCAYVQKQLHYNLISFAIILKWFSLSFLSPFFCCSAIYLRIASVLKAYKECHLLLGKAEQIFINFVVLYFFLYTFK